MAPEVLGWCGASAAEGRGPAPPGWRPCRAWKPPVLASAQGLRASVQPPTVLGVSGDRVAVPCPWPAPPARFLWPPRVPPGTEPLDSLGRARFSHRVGVKPQDLVQVLQKVQMDGTHRQAIVEVPAAHLPRQALWGPPHRSPGPSHRSPGPPTGHLGPPQVTWPPPQVTWAPPQVTWASGPSPGQGCGSGAPGPAQSTLGGAGRPAPALGPPALGPGRRVCPLLCRRCIPTVVACCPRTSSRTSSTSLTDGWSKR